MNIYNTLNCIGLKRSYSSKFLFIAFIGTHLPLIGLVCYVLMIPSRNLDVIGTVLVVLAYTLIAAIATIYILNRLLDPIRLATRAMHKFEINQGIIELPLSYNDEAGRLLQQINSTLHKTKALAEEKKDFTALLTHDIRNPLARIIGLGRLMGESPDSEEDYPQMIVENGEKAMKFISDILSILEAEDLSACSSEVEDLDLREFIKEQIDAVIGISPDKEIEFSLDVDKVGRLRVNPALFSHVMQNVLSNAIKFSSPNGTVRISANKIMGGHQLAITDQGLGFDPMDAEKLFLKFSPLKRPGTRNEPTSGIGLFLTRMLLAKQNGSIQALSEGHNKGATFVISI